MPSSTSSIHGFIPGCFRDFGYLKVSEPFTNLLTQGMVCKETQECPTHGYLYPKEVGEGRCVRCGSEVITGNTVKMSKSKKKCGGSTGPDRSIWRGYGSDVLPFCLPAGKGPGVERSGR